MDDKAKNIITVSGIVATLLFGFITIVTKDSHTILLSQQITLSIYVKGLLISSVVFIITSIFISTFSLRLQKYALPFSHKSYYEDSQTKKEEFDKGKIKKTIECSTIIFNNTLVDRYLEANSINAEENNFKTLMVTLAQWTFFIGIFLITFLIAFIMFG